MSIFDSPWGLRKIVLLGGVVTLAAFAGVASELLAQEFDEFSSSFRGGSLVANWVSDDGFEAQVWAARGVTRRGRPQEVSMTWVRGTNWTSGSQFGDLPIDQVQQGVVQVSASGPIDPDGLIVPRGLGFGHLKATIPGTARSWTTGGWSQQQRIDVEVIVDLLGEGKPTYEDSRRRTFDAASGLLTDWHTKGAFVDATGRGNIRVNGEDWLPANAVLTWGELRDTRQGSVLQHKVEGRF